MDGLWQRWRGQWLHERDACCVWLLVCGLSRFYLHLWLSLLGSTVCGCVDHILSFLELLIHHLDFKMNYVHLLRYNTCLVCCCSLVICMWGSSRCRRLLGDSPNLMLSALAALRLYSFQRSRAFKNIRRLTGFCGSVSTSLVEFISILALNCSGFRQESLVW